MTLSPQQMQRIVEELHLTINRPINIMDGDGRIIASTDPHRIGTVHQAACRLLQEGLDSLEIYPEDEYPGTKQGINLPLTFHGTLVGVAGITGDPDQVRDLGAIMKKMTEILMEDAYQKEQNLLFDNARSAFLHRWLFEGSSDRETGKNLELDGQILGIDTKLPRIAAALEPCFSADRNRNVLMEQQLQSGLKALIWETVSPRSPHVSLSLGQRVLLLCHSGKVSAVEIICRQIADCFFRQYGIPLGVGIGSLGFNRDEIVRSCQEAQKACLVSRNTKDKEIKVFGDTDFLLLLQDISRETKMKFIRQVFPGFVWEELEPWMLLLRVFFDANGSIKEGAGQLFIHKNTMQYRLNKIRQLTGYDPRIYGEAFSLYTAMVLFESITEDK